jgi:hypothetical protein
LHHSPPVDESTTSVCGLTLVRSPPLKSLIPMTPRPQVTVNFAIACWPLRCTLDRDPS